MDDRQQEKMAEVGIDLLTLCKVSQCSYLQKRMLQRLHVRLLHFQMIFQLMPGCSNIYFIIVLFYFVVFRRSSAPARCYYVHLT